MFAEMTDEMIEYVAASIREFYFELRAPPCGSSTYTSTS